MTILLDPDEAASALRVSRDQPVRGSVCPSVAIYCCPDCCLSRAGLA